MRHLDALQQGMTIFPTDRRSSSNNSDHSGGGGSSSDYQNNRWGLESYYKAIEEEQLEATKDTRKLFNPYPDLVHENIFTVAKGISSILDVTMEVLNKRLPSENIKMKVEDKISDAMSLPSFSSDINSDSGNDKNKSLTVELKSTIPKLPPDPPFSPSYISTTELETMTKQQSLPKVVLSKVDGLPLSTLGIEKEVTENITENMVNNLLNIQNYQIQENGSMKHVNNENTTVKTNSVLESTPRSIKESASKSDGKIVTFNVISDNESKTKISNEKGKVNTKPSAGNDKVFADIDKVLGMDTNKDSKNYLNLDGLPVIVNTNTFPINNSNKSEIIAVDNYMKNNYPPSNWDPRMKYHNNKLSGNSDVINNSNDSTSNRVVVIHAPSDTELMEERMRHNQLANNHVNSSAPPQVTELSLPKYPSIITSSTIARSSDSGLSYPLHRAVEGIATSHIRDNKLIINSEGKYTLPTYYSKYNNSNTYNNSYTNNGSSINPGSNVINNNNNHSSSTTIRSPDIQSNIHERESYLNKMKKLRQTLIAT